MQSFASAGIGYTTGLVASGGGGFIFKALEALGSGVAVLYDTVTRNVTFTAPNGVSTTFTTADQVVSTPLQRVFSKPNGAGGTFGGSLTIPSANGVSLTYTRFASFFTAGPGVPLDAHAFVFGVQTLASDVPTTGTATYVGGAGGTAILAGSSTGVSLAGSTASLTANFATGSIATALTLIMNPGGVPTTLDVLTGTGSLGAVKPGFSGTLTGTGSVTGNFAGAFFGPQAAEFGYDFQVGGTTAAGQGFTALGGAAGKKP